MHTITCCDQVLATVPDGQLDPHTITSEASNAFVIAVPITVDGVEPYELAPQQITATWPEAALSVTAYPDGHHGYSIRCPHCDAHAVVRDTTLARLLSSANTDEIPLTVLCAALSRLNR